MLVGMGINKPLSRFPANNISRQLEQFLHKNGPIQLKTNYSVIWQEFTDANSCLWKYYILEI